MPWCCAIYSLGSVARNLSIVIGRKCRTSNFIALKVMTPGWSSRFTSAASTLPLATQIFFTALSQGDGPLVRVSPCSVADKSSSCQPTVYYVSHFQHETVIIRG